MNLAQKYDFSINLEDFDAYFERAIEEGSMEVRMERHMIFQQFSEFEKDFYQKRYELESTAFSNKNNFMQEQLALLAQYKQEVRMNFSLSENNYILFVYAKQCEAFQTQLILNKLDIDQLQTDEDTQKLVDLFIENYPLLEVVPPNTPLRGRHNGDLFIQTLYTS